MPRAVDDFVPPREAAAILKISTQRLALLASQGRLPFRQSSTGWRLRMYPRSVLEILAKHDSWKYEPGAPSKEKAA